MNEQQNAHPIKEFRARGGIKAAIWRNEDKVNGRNVIRYSVRFQRRYCDQKGVWKTTEYFRPQDLPRLMLVAQKAFEFVTITEADEPDSPGQ